MKKIIISMINFNSEEETKACLTSLDKVSRQKYHLEIVLIDNASLKPLTITEKFISIPLHIIHNKTNVGFTGGHNLGITFGLAHAADYLLILNNDTIIDKEAIEQLFLAAEANNNIGVTIPKIYFAKGSEFHKDRYDDSQLGKVFWYAGGYMDWKNIIGHHRGVDEVDKGQFDLLEETKEATGCCMLVKREVFTKVGFYDENYFLYYEDSDLSERIKKTGYKLIYVPSAKIWHINAASTGGSGSTLQDYYISRNRMYFGMKYASRRTKLALTRESLKLLVKGRKWQKRGIWDYYLKHYGKGSYK